MKIMSLLLFFNKGFMTDYATTIGSTIYYPSRASLNEKLLNDPLKALCTFLHERTHMLDSKYINKLIYSIGYLIPQIFAIFSIFAVFNCWFLLFLLCLLPIPSFPRMLIEVRGYETSIFTYWMHNKDINLDEMINVASDSFVNSSYYYMFPFRNYIKKTLTKRIKYDIMSVKKRNKKQLPYYLQDIYLVINGLEKRGD